MGNEDNPGVAVRGEALSPERRRFLGRLSIALSAIAAAIVGIPVVGFIIGPLIQSEEPVWCRVGAGKQFPDRADRQGELRRPITDAVGRRHLADGRLVTASGRRALRRVHNQLRPSRLSGTLVAEGWAFHVPMPRRGLLRRRYGGRRAAAAQPVQISGPRARRTGGDYGECRSHLLDSREQEGGRVHQKDSLGCG